MKNMIKYFYNLEPEQVIKEEFNYLFMVNDEQYVLYFCNHILREDDTLLEFSKSLVDYNVLFSEIVLTNEKKLFALIEDNRYCLIKFFVNPQKLINIYEISNLSLNLKADTSFYSKDWNQLWSEKIDYFEYQISETGKKYPILVDSFSYFVGMAENANSYLKDTLLEEKKQDSDHYVLAHRKIRIDDTVRELYNPLNIMMDYPCRDMAEYIKYSFFHNNKNIWKELWIYFKYNYYSKLAVRMLFARCLYPSFYFDVYDDILLSKKEQEVISEVISRIDDYEAYLYDVFLFLNRYYRIPEVSWLKKSNR